LVLWNKMSAYRLNRTGNAMQSRTHHLIDVNKTAKIIKYCGAGNGVNYTVCLFDATAPLWTRSSSFTRFL